MRPNCLAVQRATQGRLEQLSMEITPSSDGAKGNKVIRKPASSFSVGFEQRVAAGKQRGMPTMERENAERQEGRESSGE